MTFRFSRWNFVVVPLIAAPVVWFMRTPTVHDQALVATVKRGDFRVVVTAAGEVRARQSVAIRAPEAVDSETYQTQISRLVPEGTLVKPGDFVAELDRTALAPKRQEAAVALEKAEQQLVQVKLDTTSGMSSARAQLTDLESEVEERKLAKEQAAYEAPSIKRQAQIDFEKAERALAQAKMDYGTKQRQAAAKVNDVLAEIGRLRTKVAAIDRLLARFTVLAPAQGMVIYKRTQGDGVRGVGSEVNTWNPTVALLPDFSEMESVTYVSEVDVAKLAVGQPVRITLDSDPWKRLRGKVSAVANMGEQRKSDAKVFEVKILVEDADTTLRPGMTTANRIETTVVPGALLIPIDAVMSAGDTAFVYRQVGGSVVRQQIQLGAVGENTVVVQRGLAEGDRVLLTEPANSHDLPRRPLP